jgi:hypothetical protein
LGWAVDLNEATAESGLRKTREAALTAVVLTIDRWLAPTQRIDASPAGDAEPGVSPEAIRRLVELGLKAKSK